MKTLFFIINNDFLLLFVQIIVKHLYEGKNRALIFICILCFMIIIRKLSANVCDVYFDLLNK